MRIVFLDMDGVLNSGGYFADNPHCEEPQVGGDDYWGYMVGPTPVQHLNAILAATGAKVVLSTSWRYHVDPDQMQRVLDSRGFKGEVLGRTPTNSELPEGFRRTGLRGTEVEVWLTKNKHLEIESFVILDDLGPGSFGHMTPYLVQTGWAGGLQEHHIKAAIDMLQTAG